MREKISIPKSISTSRGPNKGPQKKGGINGAIKPTAKIAKSSQTGEKTEADSTTNSDDGEVANDDGGQEWEAGKPISKDADKAAADATKALWSGYWDYKRYELDNQRGMQQDQLDFQRQMQQQALANQNSGIAAQGIGALTSALGGLGGGRGSGGGASSGGGGATSAKPESHMLAENEKKAFEDEDKIVQVDAKGNPIKPENGQIAQSTTQGQRVEGQEQTAFQARPAAHEDMVAHQATVESYGNESGMSISSHGTELQANGRSDSYEDISFEIAENEVQEEPEIPEPEIEIPEEEEVA